MSDQKIEQQTQNFNNVPHHCVGLYDPMRPVSSTIYAHEVRKVIKEVLARGRTPILEGGSPFYIQQVFNPTLANVSDADFFEARRVAKKVIEADGFDFRKSF